MAVVLQGAGAMYVDILPYGYDYDVERMSVMSLLIVVSKEWVFEQNGNPISIIRTAIHSSHFHFSTYSKI